MADTTFSAVRVARRTAETDFAIRVTPRPAAAPLVELPNRVLAHFVDHLSRGAGVQIAVERAAWPQSWEFDHVLCEDTGQLIGRAFAAIAEERTAASGIMGRAVAASAMDDSASAVRLAFESRPRCTWCIPRRVDIDGFVDSWYSRDGAPGGVCYGTNLRQFLDGFAYGSGATLVVEISAGGNLHHLYETIFRNLGDTLGAALGTARRLPGEGSGLAGAPVYDVSRVK
jgi:imidazoleglycerol phosphate dehydratase HisB